MDAHKLHKICYSFRLQKAHIFYVIYVMHNAVQQENCSSFFLHTLVSVLGDELYVSIVKIPGILS